MVTESMQQSSVEAESTRKVHSSNMGRVKMGFAPTIWCQLNYNHGSCTHMTITCADGDIQKGYAYHVRDYSQISRTPLQVIL